TSHHHNQQGPPPPLLRRHQFDADRPLSRSHSPRPTWLLRMHHLQQLGIWLPALVGTRLKRLCICNDLPQNAGVRRKHPESRRQILRRERKPESANHLKNPDYRRGLGCRLLSQGSDDLQREKWVPEFLTTWDRRDRLSARHPLSTAERCRPGPSCRELLLPVDHLAFRVPTPLPPDCGSLLGFGLSI